MPGDYLGSATFSIRPGLHTMSDLDFFLIIGTIAVFTVGIFWSHFSAEAEQIRRKYEKKK